MSWTDLGVDTSGGMSRGAYDLIFVNARSRAGLGEFYWGR